ncbi:MAG: Isoquinoline 1-oxidoreductase subunit, partial [Acidobacteriota bacterium]
VDLRSPADFESIEDPTARSQAFFVEAGKVLLHPRCVNCHPAGDTPLQGENGEMHQPKVVRGPEGFGVPGLACATCHHAENFDPGGVPGAPKWHLAPASMAWEGRTLAQLCAQLKDPVASHMDLKGVAKHMAEDPLVAWAWEPGEGREVPPGSQEQLSQLISAWVASGAECPD